MKYTSTYIAGLALLIGGTSLQAAAIAPTGLDNKVEWQVRSNWQIASEPLDLVHSLDGKLVFILGKDHTIQVYDNSGNLQGRIPVGEGVTSIDIAPQGEALYLIDSSDNTFTSVSINFVTEIDVTGSPFKGRTDAPVTIAVFTDFE